MICELLFVVESIDQAQEAFEQCTKAHFYDYGRLVRVDRLLGSLTQDLYLKRKACGIPEMFLETRKHIYRIRGAIHFEPVRHNVPYNPLVLP